MRYLIALLIFIAGWFVTEPTDARQVAIPHIEYINHFLRNYPKRRAKALEIMPTLEAISLQYGFDPIIPTVIIACESAWKQSACGEIGEIGLMQVHGRCAKGFDLSTIDGQLESGMTCLDMSRGLCDGSLTQTMTMYMSGRCHARTERTKRVVARRVRIIEKWRALW